MNPRLRSILIGIGLLTLAIMAIVLIPRGLSVYYQSRGGQHIDYVMRSVEGIQELVCKPLPESNQAAIEEVESGIEDLNRAARFNRRNSHTYYQLGKAYCLLGEPEEALKSYQQYTELRPDNPLGHIGLGFVYDLLDKPAFAKEAWIAAGLEPDDFIRRSKEEYEFQNYSDALFWMNKLSNYGEDIKSSEAFLNSQISTKYGEEDSAQDFLELAVGTNEGWVDQEIQFLAWYTWGKLLFDQGFFDDAESALTYSLSLSPDSEIHNHPLSEVYRLLGLIYWSEDNPKLASTAFQTALDINPQNAWAHIHYGKFIWDINQNPIGEVEEEFNVALSIAPNNPIVWESMVRFWVDNNEVERALNICERAMNENIAQTAIPSCMDLDS